MPICRPGDEVLFSEHAFLVYKIATLANSAKPVMVPERHQSAASRWMSMPCWRAVTPQDAHGLSSPIPTIPPAPIISHEEMRRLHAGLPAHALLVIDAAYSEYVRTQ